MLFSEFSCVSILSERGKKIYFLRDLSSFTDSAAAVVEKMITVYNQELFWCNGMPTEPDKALKWIQSPRAHILPTNKPAELAARLPMVIAHLHVSCTHSPLGLVLT